MNHNNSLIAFSAALVLGTAMVSGTLLYTSKSSTTLGNFTTITDENNNTYVVEKEEPTKLTVISDATCKACSTEKLEPWLKKQLGVPLAIRRLDYSEDEAKKILADNEATFLPYMLLGKEIEKASNLPHLTHHTITKSADGYFADLVKIGAPVGRYLNTDYFQKDDQNAPKFTAAKTEYDFGTIRLGNGKVSTEFIVKNEGKSPLTFVNANTSCGCTTAKIVLPNESSPEYLMAGHGEPVKWSGSLAPGEEGKIVVYYDPTVHPELNGAVTREVKIDTNDPNTPQIKFKIHVNQTSN